MRRPSNPYRRFIEEREAMAAVEFAVILPVLLAIMLGGLQLATYANALRRLDLLVRSTSEMISQAVPPANSSTATVNSLDLHFAYDSALVTFPYVMNDAKSRGNQWWQNVVINFASIRFTQTSSGCQGKSDQSPCTTANVVWTSTGVSSGTYRVCSTPQLPADDASPPTQTTLPRSLYSSTSIIVVDVVFTFRPAFGASFVPPVRIARSAYIQPRYATLINFDTTNTTGIASKCPGY